MIPEKVNHNPASPEQLTQLGFMIATQFVKNLKGKLTFDQAQTAITDKNLFDVGKIANYASTEVFKIPIDPWAQEKKDISLFYRTCFKDKRWKNPNFDKVAFPEIEGNCKRPDYFFNSMTPGDALDAYEAYFGKDSVWIGWEKELNSVIKKDSLPLRPTGDYIGLHVGGVGPDEDHLHESYLDFHEDPNFMNPIEGIIGAFRYRFQFNVMWDQDTTTLLHSSAFYFGEENGSIFMNGSQGLKFIMSYDLRGSRCESHGPRRIHFKSF